MTLLIRWRSRGILKLLSDYVPSCIHWVLGLTRKATSGSVKSSGECRGQPQILKSKQSAADQSTEHRDLRDQKQEFLTTSEPWRNVPQRAYI